jgi:hypothetical protein
VLCSVCAVGGATALSFERPVAIEDYGGMLLFLFPRSIGINVNQCGGKLVLKNDKSLKLVGFCQKR